MHICYLQPDPYFSFTQDVRVDRSKLLLQERVKREVLLRSKECLSTFLSLVEKLALRTSVVPNTKKSIDGLRKTGDAPGHKPRLLLLVVLRILVVVVVVVVVGSSISCCCCWCCWFFKILVVVVVVVVGSSISCCCCCWCCWFLDFLLLSLLSLLLLLCRGTARARARAKTPLQKASFCARARAVPWSVISTRKVSQNHRIYAIFSTC